MQAELYHELLKTAYMDMQAEKQAEKLHGRMLTEKERQAFKPFRDLFDSVAEIIVTNRQREQVPLRKLLCENRHDCIQFYNHMGNCGRGVSVSIEEDTPVFYTRRGYSDFTRVSRADAWNWFIELIAGYVGAQLCEEKS